MKSAMMRTTKRDGELIADPAAQRAWLHVPQVVGVRWTSAAQETRLRRYEFEVGTIAVSAGFTQRESAFIDVPRYGIVHLLFDLRDSVGRARRDRTLRAAEFNTASQSGHQC